jgi:hypothetical protein
MYKRPTDICNKMHTKEINQIFHILSKYISVKDIYVFPAVIVQMGHDYKPSMKLYWTKEELYHVPFYSSVMPHDHLLMILKYLHLRTIRTHQHKTEKIPIMTDYGKSDKYLTF